MADFEKKIINHVYLKEGTNTLENVRVQVDFSINDTCEKVQLDENKLSVNIISKIDVSLNDIENILTTLQKNNFSRLNINLANDVNCFFYMGDKKYFVKLMQKLKSEEFKAELIEC